MNDLNTTPSHPYRVAIVGAGPSGFFTVDALLKKGLPLSISVFEKWPVPYGLVRFGIAPDHQNTKQISRLFDKAVSNEAVRCYGNVMVGRDISVEELGMFFDAVVLTYGAASHRSLRVAGEELPGSYSANAFVGWYNGEPGFAQLQPDLSCEHAVIIGNGNVAMDVARILAKKPSDLAGTDIASEALQALRESRIKNIHVLGRRGPVQASFTYPELKAFQEIEGVTPLAYPEDLQLSDASQQELAGSEAENRRQNLDLLEAYAGNAPSPAGKNVWFRFLRSPAELKGRDRVETILLEKNELEGEAGWQKVKGTGLVEELEAGLVIRCIGYRGEAMPGVPFDDHTGTVPSVDSRVMDGGSVIPGLYAAGWIQEGPVGLVGTSKRSGLRAAKTLAEDLPTLERCGHSSNDELEAFLAGRGIRWVSAGQWQKIQDAETAAGQQSGKVRDKFTSVDQMLSALDQ